jgi:hypothetical protein
MDFVTFVRRWFAARPKLEFCPTPGGSTIRLEGSMADAIEAKTSANTGIVQRELGVETEELMIYSSLVGH